MDCKDFFDFDSLNRYVEFDKPLYSIVSKRKTAKLVYMSPKQYIYNIAQGFGGLSYDDVVNSGAVIHSNVDKYAEAMKSGAKFPIGYYTKDNSNQEGRHRALAAMKLGCDKIPVIQFMKISDREFLNVVNKLKNKSFDELDNLFKKIGFQNGITQLGYNELNRYVEYNLNESYDDIGVDYVKNERPKIGDISGNFFKKIVGNFTLVNNKYEPESGLLGDVHAYYNEDGTEVGNASYGYDYKGGPLKASIDVRPDMRRRGIGSEMYKFIEEITGEKLHPEPKHSDSAEKFWNQPNREFGIKENKMNLDNFEPDLIEKKQYVYHGTSRGAAYKIQRDGKMVGGQASGSPNAPLFFSNQEQYAKTYAQRKDYSGGLLLRVVKTSDMKVNDVLNHGGYVEYYTNREIPIDEVEVKTSNSWIPLEKYNVINENIIKVIRQEIREVLDSGYKSWKRKNVTLRGMSDVGQENSGGARFGSGLYTAFLGNRAMAKEYGKVYFVVGAIPNNPKIFNDTNQAEIWIHYNLYRFEDENQPNPRRFHQEGKTLEGEMLKLGYDGLVIRGREMVNYSPSDDIMYFSNENQLIDYYEFVVKNRETITEQSGIVKEEHRIESWKKSIQAISKQLNIELVKFIGGGLWGIAYEIPGNRVLKITEDDREIENAKSLVGKNLDRLANIYKVYNIKGHSDKKVIIMEKLQPLNSEYDKALDIFSGYFTDFYNGEWTWGEIAYNGYEEDFDEYLKSAKYNGIPITDIYSEILQILEEAGSVGIQLTDMHAGNMGLKNGQLAIFDIV